VQNMTNWAVLFGALAMTGLILGGLSTAFSDPLKHHHGTSAHVGRAVGLGLIVATVACAIGMITVLTAA
jgi:hypothetical protein